MTTWKNSPWPLKPHFSQTLWYYSNVPQMSNLLKISWYMEKDFRNGFFNTLHIDLKVESNFLDQLKKKKVAPKCISYSSCDQWCVTVPRCACRWGEIVQWGHESMVQMTRSGCSPYGKYNATAGLVGIFECSTSNACICSFDIKWLKAAVT